MAADGHGTERLAACPDDGYPIADSRGGLTLSTQHAAGLGP